MTTHTHTKEWQPLKKWGARAITVGMIGHAFWASAERPDGDIGTIIWLAIGAGIVLTLIGSVKAGNALQTGIISQARIGRPSSDVAQGGLTYALIGNNRV